MADGPDFLCIGLQKAGTGWLYDQLQFHPDFWMPPVKELHFLDNSFPNKKVASTITKVLSDFDRASRGRNRKDRRELDERDRDFYECAKACIGKGNNLDLYAALFRQKGELIAGDITPAYSNIEEEKIDAFVARFPKTKILILLRDPVKRAISQIGMAYRGQKAPEASFRELEAFKTFFEGGPFGRRSYATRYVKNWGSRLPAAQFAYFFFDDLIAQPDVLRSDILTFLGADPSKSSRFPPEFNRKSKEEKLVLSEDIQAYIQEIFQDELKLSAEMFGGHANAWLARYK